MLPVLAFLLLSTAQGGPPQITSFTGPPANLIPFQLETLTLQCTATGNPEPAIDFLRNGTKLVASTTTLINSNSIRIRRVDYARDSGLYQCRARNKDGGVLSDEIDIKIRVLGFFSQPNRDIDPVKVVDVTVGRPVELRCPPHSFTSPANFLWGSIPKAGTPVILHATSRRYVLSNGNLFYSYLEESDITEINDKLGGVSCILYILGKYRPSVKFRLKKQGAIVSDFQPVFREKLPTLVRAGIGSSYTFFCAVGGKPNPSILWYFNNVAIRTDTPGITISPEGQKLTLKTIARASAGLYHCQVENRLGRIRSDSRLSVEYPPARNFILNDVKSRPNVDIKLNCTASSGTLPVFYQWFRNGERVWSNTSYQISAGFLVVKSANVSTSGVFQCMARNLFGSLLSKVTLDINAGYSSQGGDEGFSWEVIVAITCGGVAFIVLVTVGTYFALK
eukprot:gene2111-17691_t